MDTRGASAPGTITQPHAAVIGVGDMGRAMVRALVGAGYALTVWNRTASRARAVAGPGVTAAESASAAVAGAPVALVCVRTYEDVREIFEGVGTEALRDRTIVNLTWGTPSEAEDLECDMRCRGCAYLDGALCVPPEGIGQPGTELLFSGSSETWESSAALLRVLGGASRLVGEPIGLANALALAVPGLFYNLALGGLHEAAAYASSLGIPPSELASQVRLALRTLDGALAETLADMEGGTNTAHQPPSAEVSLEAIQTVVAAMRTQGQRATLAQALVDLLERGLHAGKGEGDAAALLGMLRAGG